MGEAKNYYLSFENKREKEFAEKVLQGLISKEGYRPVLIDVREIAEKVSEEVGAEVNAKIVSLDKNFFKGTDLYLDVTRLTSEDGKIVSLGPRSIRSGYLTEQIKTLLKRIKGEKKLVLVDIGAFSGGTLLEIIEKIQKYEGMVEKIYLGISTKEGIENLEKAGVPVQVNYVMENLVGWIEVEDFLGTNGRKVLNTSSYRKSEREGLPMTINGLTVYIPYFLGLPEWSSLSSETLHEIHIASLKYFPENITLEELGRVPWRPGAEVIEDINKKAIAKDIYERMGKMGGFSI